jgi:hypothetical protein
MGVTRGYGRLSDVRLDGFDRLPLSKFTRLSTLKA